MTFALAESGYLYRFNVTTFCEYIFLITNYEKFRSVRIMVYIAVKGVVFQIMSRAAG